MLDADPVILTDFQRTADNADFIRHVVFINGNNGEILLPCDTGNHLLAWMIIFLHDDGTTLLRMIGIQDVDRDVFFLYRKNRLLMQNTCPHIGKLTQLGVGDGVDAFWMVDNSRVSHQYAGNICPVLIHIRIQNIRQN